MHEVLLFGRVPAPSHSQVLSVLAGMAAMQPHILLEHHLIFKPTRLPGSMPAKVTAKAGSQPQTLLQSQQSNDLFYLQLVGHLDAAVNTATAHDPDAVMPHVLGGDKIDEVSEKTANRIPKDEPKQTQDSIDFSAHPWTLEFRDLPEVPGRRPVTTRLMASIPITSGSPLGFVEALGYRYTSSYVLRGHRLVHNNIIIQLQRIFRASPSPGAAPTSPSLPSSAYVDLLDSSGVYLLQAAIRVQDGSKPELIAAAMSELMAFRDAMRGVVDLEIGDRLALDTRVR
jgi:mediator of RNA polymerase II transcription subunit 18, fungi type